LRISSVIAKEACILLILIITLPVAFLSYDDCVQEKNLLIQQKFHQLLDAATLLKTKIPSSINSTLAKEDANSPNKKERILILNKQLQPLVNQFCKQHPNLGFGVYSLNLHSVLAIGPNFSYKLLHDVHNPNYLESYKTNQIEVQEINKSLTWRGKPILNLTYPIWYNGKIVGHIWSSIKIEDLNKELYIAIMKRICMIIFIWLAVVLVIWWIFYKLRLNLLQLLTQIRNEDDNPDGLKDFPELFPVLETITSLREKYLDQVEALRQLVDNTPMEIISIDNKKNIKAINKAYLLANPQFTYKDLIGKPFTTFTEHEGVKEENLPIIQALDGKITRNVILNTLNKRLLINAYPIKHSKTKEIIGALAIAQDITEQEKLKSEMERLDRLNLVGSMAASLAHEIRNPLTAVRGYTQMLMAKTDEGSSNFFKIILEELDRTNSIIENFLSLARNKLIKKAECNLNKIIDDIFPLLETESIKRDMSVKLDLADNLPNLYLNPRQIKQLILNLGLNALDAMEPEGKLTIQTRYKNNMLQLKVSDTGCGIPKENLDKLFEPFYTSKESGTGLGLSVCWSIAQQHQAEINVQSQEGIGTTFIVTFNSSNLSPSKASIA